MKRRILTLVLLLVAAAFAAEANPVDMRTVREVAMKFMNANSEVPLRSADDLRLVKTYNISRGDAAFYIFNTSNGFVIVSADDCATPILGYSNERQFDVENIPVQLQGYLQSFVEQIEYGIENHLEADETRTQQWEMVRTTGRMTNNRTDEAVGPLLTTTWDQNSPYNLFVPSHCLTGCVATAMAQVMKYWEWPVQGTGEHSYQWNSQTLSANFGETTYDWANMLDSYDSQSTQEQREAVATLMFHCGVSVNMHYGYAVSTASLNPSSLINYFNYSDEMSLECRDYYSDATWKAKLKDCLDLGRPLYYDGQPSSGTGQVGHAFVCDGYDNNDLFHFNMGWGGGGDFYALDAVYYNLHNCAVFNIHPQSDEPTVYEINVSVNNDEYGAASGGGTFIHGDTVTLSATADAGYCFQYWVENGGVASTNPNYSFPANFNRNLTAVFTGPVTISVSATEGGTVSGGGVFCYEECEVIATPDEGFEFAYWSVNDNVVSIDADYIFVVTGETHLTAHFIVDENIVFADSIVKSICLNRWDYDGDGELSLAEAAGVTSIGLTFKNNSNITSFDELQYFTNLTSINGNAFYSCSGLTSIILPNAVTSIDDYAFASCTGLISLNIPSSVTLIGDYAFRYCSGLTSLTLPNSITSIGYSAFYGCTGLTSLSLPNSLTTIGGSAFYNCSGLTGSLTLPDSITTISSYSFYGCSRLASLTLPNSVTWIGTYAFSGCSGLTSLTLPNSVTSISDYAFSSCSGLTSLTFPNAITSIGKYAFYGCSGLTSLTLPNTITSISASAFRGCSGLTSLIIPDSIASIDVYAFYGCSGLATLTLPASVVSIGSYAFNECSGLASIIVLADTPPTIEYNTFPYPISNILLYVPCQSVGAYQSSNNWRSFSNIIGLCTPGTITLVSDQPENGEVSGTGTYESGTFCTVTATPSEGYCFVNWTENDNVVSTDVSYSFVVTGDRLLTAHFAMDGIIVFADANVKAICLDNWDTNNDGELSLAEAARVTNIARVFKGHTEITSFDELQHFVNLSYLSSSAFSGCSGLTSVTLPSALTTMGDYAFYNCSGLISLPITNSITTIGKYVFSGCTALTSLTLPDSIISIGDYAFKGCTGFTGDLTIPNSITSIGNYAFSDCNGFTGNLTIGNAVTSIGNYAFSGCSGITGDLHIPNSVISIGNYAFNGCNGFRGNLTIGDAVTSIGNYAFNNCYGFRGNLTIGDAVTSIGNYAFNNCYGFTGDLNIPNSVSSIGNYAFSGCNGFKGTLTLGDSVYSIGNYAFYNCYGFTGDLNIPNSVRYIRDYAFRGCNGFKGHLTIGNSVISIGNYAFYNCYGFTGNLSIPNSVTSIGQYAFFACTGFKGNLTIGTSVITIGNSAFSLCQNIKGSLTIPNSVTSIGEYAFGGINGLWGSLTIGSSVTSIGRSAFSNDSGLRSIIILAYQPPTVGTNAFYNLTSNIPIYVPCESVETYQSATGWDAFTNINGMCSPVAVSVVADPMEGGVVSGAGMYEGGTFCTVTATPNEGYCFVDWIEYDNVASFDSIYGFVVAEECVLTAHFVPSGNIVFADDTVKALCVQNWDTNGDGELSYHEAAKVTSLGYVFRDNMEITSFDELQYFISLSSINSYAFYNCYNLRSLIIPGTVTLIGESAFCACGLTGNLTIPNTVTMIGSSAFYGCSGLTGGLTIPDAVTSIGEHAFGECHGLTGSLLIGNSVTSIGRYAFYGCSGLTSLVIGNSVTSIGNYAFSYCYDLNSMIVVTEVPPTLGTNVFYQVSTNIPVYVPCESVEAYQSAAGWNAFANITGMCSSGTVSVAADPVEGGTVSGAGTYEGGTFCTVTATPNEGYYFANWTKNGNVVSNDSNYSFVVTGESAMIAHFVTEGNIVFADDTVKALCVQNWDTNGDGELSYLEAAQVWSLGNVFSYNMGITSFDELQYFIGLSSIDDYAFGYCYNLSSMAFPNSVISIGCYAFYACHNLIGSLTIPNSVTSIDEWAFGECGGLTGSLTIGNSVTSIDGYAFSFCYGLSSMIVLSETPPTLRPSGFYGVATDIPVYVPCESVEAYQSAAGWNAFPNITGMCSSGTVSVVAEPVEGGTVSGAGTYEGGSSCTIVATPSEGYRFVNWTENGDVVSTNASYEFIVVGDATYVAHFIPSVVALSAGWNWFSSYIEMDPVELLDMLKASLGDNGLSIEANGMGTIYDGVEWFGDLDYEGIYNEQMYLIQVSTDCAIELVGPAADPSYHEITIYPGWNWIGFPCAKAMEVSVALSWFEAEEGDVIESNSDIAMYLNGQWDEFTLVPGQGYLYYSNCDNVKTFYFQMVNSKAKH